MQRNIGTNAGRVHHRGNGKDNEDRDESLDRRRKDLRNRHEPNRAGRLDAVLYLPCESELLRHRERNRLNALKHDRNTHHARHENRGESRGTGRRSADRLTDLWEHEEEDEAEEEGLDQRSEHKLLLRFPDHDEVTKYQRSHRGTTRFKDATRGRSLEGGVSAHASRNSLPVRLMKTVSSVGSATAKSRMSTLDDSAVATTRGTSRSVLRMSTSTTLSVTRVLTMLSISRWRSRANCSAFADTLIVTIVSAPVLFFRLAGVSSAKIFPWSMIATRSQS